MKPTSDVSHSLAREQNGGVELTRLRADPAFIREHLRSL